MSIGEGGCEWNVLWLIRGLCKAGIFCSCQLAEQFHEATKLSLCSTDKGYISYLVI